MLPGQRRKGRGCLAARPGSGVCCAALGFTHCPLLGNGKNCSACLVQQSKHKKPVLTVPRAAA